ncbi:DUF898 domain-containing protein [Shewanella sp. D64]|uniref:YjgN family protein n=1 Tax=unclassified Shewanella TaxID=196818 RepID=UPI0022BA4B0C|nr:MULTISPECIES: YjgN family protein [unclassified Shewanella]MEC4726115.1 DUF898 domain-containing protein [Shewanella sp. D64]MEC4737969.1 DUF898 domain-containing protein [Shewanella sp. E94]WBJ96168.1 DUF898 domain-containing protein [Shewanella sp. MTB7]
MTEHNTDLSTKQHSFNFHGNASEFFGIWIVNILLTIVTLGIYSAWAKVRTNTYFYGNTELDGDRFEYLAKPMQILIGRIIAVVALIAWTILSSINPIAAIVCGLLLALALPYLSVRNIRFDARITRFRNVRFNFEGSYSSAYLNILVKPLATYALIIISSFGFAALFMDSHPAVAIIGGILLFTLTAVFGYAWVMVGMASYVVNGYRYGDKPFNAGLNIRQYAKIAALGGALFLGSFILGFLLIIALGMFDTIQALFTGEVIDPATQMSSALTIFAGYLYMFFIGFVIAAFVKTRIRNYLFSKTQIDNELQLVSNMTLGGYLTLIITNLLLTIFTLGLGRAWADIRHAQYMASVTQLDGDLALMAVQDHNIETSNAIADEMVDVFDINLNIV